MAQTAKFIDITKTFLPIDPGTLPPSLHIGKGEAEPETKMAVMAYEGYNFLPTGHGYKSYFGTDVPFNMLALPAGVNVDKIFVVNSTAYTSYFVALTDRGIYTNTGAANTAWVQSVVLATIVPPLKEEWSTALVGNSIYMYRAKEAAYYRLDSAVPNVFVAVVPTFLNMAGQRGLFKAGGNLGFWDSLQSISWSNLDNLGDFEPSLETLAGNVLFKEITGSIVNILPYGESFIVYATHSVVLIEKDITQSSQWNPTVILANAGPAYPDQVCSASPDTLHFAYTSIGLYKIEGKKATMIVPEVFDLLKESLSPIGIQFLENRYLCLKIIEGKFIEGLVEFESKSYSTIAGGVVQPGSYSGAGSLYTAQARFNDDEILARAATGAFDEQQNKARADLAFARQFDNTLLAPAGNLFVPTWQSSFYNRRIKVSNTPGFLDATAFRTVAQNTTLQIAAGNPSLRLDGVGTSLVTYSSRWQAIYEGGGDSFTTENLQGSGPSTLHNWLAIVNDYQSISSLAIENHLFQEPIQRTSTPFSYNIWLNYGIDPRYESISYPDANTGRLLGAAPGVYREVATAAGAVASVTYKANTLTMTRPTDRALFVAPANFKIRYIFTDARLRNFAIDHNINFDQNTPLTATNSTIRDVPLPVPTYVSLDTPFLEDTDMYVSGWTYININGNQQTFFVGQEVTPDYISSSIVGVGIYPDYELPSVLLNTDPWLIDLLDANEISVQLQAGSPGPVYPTYAGMWVYDTAYKKWGKSNGAFKTLVDLSAINTFQGPLVTTSRFGINAGILKTDGFLYRFNQRPAASYIKYGKIGYNRLGFTSLEEVKVQFRIPSTGSIQVEGSLDGKNPEGGLVFSLNYTAKTSLTVFPAMPARWHTIQFTGQFDLAYLEYRGFTQGRR